MDGKMPGQVTKKAAQLLKVDSLVAEVDRMRAEV